MYNVIDLFAGAGGLSCGFLQTGRFDIKVAAENNPKAKATYINNHRNVQMESDVKDINYDNILRKYGKLDVVIGGPPCQGFSNANRQKSTIVSNNNRLVKEYVRAILEVKPRVFVMENVGMLKSDVHRFFYSYEDKEIVDRLELKMHSENIHLFPADYEVNNIHRIVDCFDVYVNNLWSKEDYSIINQLYKYKGKEKFKTKFEKYKNYLLGLRKKIEVHGRKRNTIEDINWELCDAIDSYSMNTNVETLEELETIITKSVYFQGFLYKLKELNDNQIIIDKYSYNNGVYVTVHSYAVLEYIVKRLELEAGYKLSTDVLNATWYGVPQKRQRFIIIGTREKNKDELKMPEKIYADESDFRTVRDAIEDLEVYEPSINKDADGQQVQGEYMGVLSELRDSNMIYNHITTETREDAQKRFEVLQQGQNFHDLDDELKATYTDVKRTQNTVYLRLKYDEPSSTVINVRKSMWIHPTQNRALSIREAARLQSFPDSFVFTGTKDSQYQQVGNAVPPMLASAIANQVIRILDGNV
jgi:DNA (cytosine-5)-methyltransferase 1